MHKTMRQILSNGILTLFLTQIGFSQSIDKFTDLLGYKHLTNQRHLGSKNGIIDIFYIGQC